MTRSLEDVKRELSNRFLGKAGIHSVGISRADNAVRLYVQSDGDADLNEVLSEIEKEAAPYKVIPIQSDRASTT